MSLVLYSVTNNKGLQVYHLCYSEGKHFWGNKVQKYDKTISTSGIVLVSTRLFFPLQMITKTANQKSVSHISLGMRSRGKNASQAVVCHKHKLLCCVGNEPLLYFGHLQRDHTLQFAGFTSRNLRVAPHASGASGSSINEKLTGQPHFTIDDKVEGLPPPPLRGLA